jgi:hypothetical protein
MPAFLRHFYKKGIKKGGVLGGFTNRKQQGQHRVLALVLMGFSHFADKLNLCAKHRAVNKALIHQIG